MALRNNRTIVTMPFMTPEELTMFRERLGLSQTELAAKLRVARNTVWRWEADERKIPEFLDLALKTVERELLESRNTID